MHVSRIVILFQHIGTRTLNSSVPRNDHRLSYRNNVLSFVDDSAKQIEIYFVKISVGGLKDISMWADRNLIMEIYFCFV